MKTAFDLTQCLATEWPRINVRSDSIDSNPALRRRLAFEHTDHFTGLAKWMTRPRDAAGSPCSCLSCRCLNRSASFHAVLPPVNLSFPACLLLVAYYRRHADAERLSCHCHSPLLKRGWPGDDLCSFPAQDSPFGCQRLVSRAEE